MLSYDIVNGVGLLKKKDFVKPYWYGLESIKDYIEEINGNTGVLNTLVTNCQNFDPSDAINTFFRTDIPKFQLELKNIKDNINPKTISYNPDQGLYNSGGNPVDITPLYILNLGSTTDKTSSLGKILQDFQNTFINVFNNYTLPVKALCEIIKDGNSLNAPLGDVGGIIDNLQDSMSSITNDVVDLMTKYKKYITEYLLGTFLGFNIVLMIFIFIEAIMLIFYSNRNYNLIRRHLICVWAFMGFMLIFFFIFAGIFGIVSSLLNSIEPRIISGGENIKNVDVCLRGDGDLLKVFLEEDSIEFTDSINTLFNMYIPINNYIQLSEDTNKNDFNTLSSIDDLIEEYEDYKDDILLTTSYQEHGNLDMSIQLEELNKYTVYGRYYQDACATKIYDLYVSSKSKCPSNEQYTCIKIDDLDVGSHRYDNACPLVSSRTHTFNSVKDAVVNLGGEIKSYKTQNSDILNNLITHESITGEEWMGLKELQDFADDFKKRLRYAKEKYENSLSKSIDLENSKKKEESENYNLINKSQRLKKRKQRYVIK